MDDATKKGLKANEQVVPASEAKRSEAKRLKARIRELERMLGKVTMEKEILQVDADVGRALRQGCDVNTSAIVAGLSGWSSHSEMTIFPARQPPDSRIDPDRIQHPG